MPNLADLCTGISVAFAVSSNLRTLLPRLTEALATHLPVVEVEAVWLTFTEESVIIEAAAPAIERRWSGRRSARYFERKAISTPTWDGDSEPARVAFTPVEARLTLPVGRSGCLSVGFSTEKSVLGVGSRDTDIWVEELAGHCHRLGQLDAIARIAHRAHRHIGELEARLEELLRRTNTETSVARAITETPVKRESKQVTEVPVKAGSEQDTEIPVKTMEAAMVECISRALHASHGRIYGDHGAAKLLGLKPSTLQSKMQKLGIERQVFVR